jgi:hypothetical protein
VKPSSRFIFVLFAAAVCAIVVLPGCASHRRAEYDAALLSSRPPEDFWLGITVLKAPADTASRAAGYLRMPVATRPARYVVEADRILRAAVGSGSVEETFPDQTRQLTQAQFDDLWMTLKTSSLVSNDNPSQVGRAPTIPSLGNRTVYVVEFSIGGDRRTLAIDADPTPGLGAEDVKKLVEKLAALAWMK